ncbi:MAG: hypothetical protein ACRDRG_05650, partial [Pseudonocardiaceae bacterium]
PGAPGKRAAKDRCSHSCSAAEQHSSSTDQCTVLAGHAHPLLGRRCSKPMATPERRPALEQAGDMSANNR